VIGDKMSFTSMTVSSFGKFIKDLNIIPKDKLKTIQLDKSVAQSKSPWKQLSRTNSARLSPRKLNTTNLKTINSTTNLNFGGKLVETDIEIIFNSLCG